MIRRFEAPGQSKNNLTALAIFFLTAHSFLLPRARYKAGWYRGRVPITRAVSGSLVGGGKVGPDILLCPAHSDFYPNYNNLSSIRHVGQ